MKIILLALISLYSSTCIYSQITFHKKFESIYQNNTLYSISTISPQSDSSYLIAIHHLDNHNGDLSILYDLNDSGKIDWVNRYPQLSEIDESDLTPGGFVANAYTRELGSYTNTKQVFMKCDHHGNVMWAKIGQESSQYYSGLNGNKPLQCPGGHIFISHYRDSNSPSAPIQTKFYKLGLNGDLIWAKTYFYQYNNKFSSNLIVGDTLFCCGYIQGDACLFKLNINDGTLFDAITAGVGIRETFTSIEILDDGNYLLAGATNSPAGSERTDGWLLKMSPGGNIIWSKSYKQSGNSIDFRMVRVPGYDNRFFISPSQTNDFANSTTGNFIGLINETGDFLWCRDYSGGQNEFLKPVANALDGGAITVSLQGQYVTILKTDLSGNVHDNCCPENISFEISNFPVFVNHFPLSSLNINSLLNYSITPISDTIVQTINYCTQPLTSQSISLSFCSGDSINLNNHYYSISTTVLDTVPGPSFGCDTVKIYHISSLPHPEKFDFINFCPGTVVTLNGTVYSAPQVVKEVLPATVGCDTLVYHILQYRNLPTQNEFINFCRGDSVLLAGTWHFYPGIVHDTLPGAGNACDTVVHYYLNYLNYTASAASLHCPDDMQISLLPGNSIPVLYSLPQLNSDCPCPDHDLNLVSGLPSGAGFPVGPTKICYEAKDACNNKTDCCFTINVIPVAACDEKVSDCMDFELLDYSSVPNLENTYRFLLRNNCNSPLKYLAIQVPNGLNALAPANGSTYVSALANNYQIRNPNLSPFHSLRFKPVNTGIAHGAFDLFEYTLPPLASPLFIHIQAETEDNTAYSTILNTFGCNNGAVNRNPETSGSTSGFSVYPNPASTELYLQWESGIQPESLQILDALGHILFSTPAKELGSSVLHLEIPASWATGVYVAACKSVDGTVSRHKFSVLR